MSTVLVVVIVIIVILVIGGAAFMAVSQGPRKRLQTKFGPEYDRAVQKHESTREAEQELLARQKRHDGLDIKPRPRGARTAPRRVAAAAGTLRGRARERGHRGGPPSRPRHGRARLPDRRIRAAAEDLSVEHAGTIDRYRAAHEIGTRAEAKQASTEDLRQAMVHYRTLFTELLGETGADTTRHDRDRTHDRTDDGAHDTTRDEAESEARTDDSRTDARAETDAERDADAEAAADRDVNAEANGHGPRAQAESGTRTGGMAGRRGDAGDEGA